LGIWKEREGKGRDGAEGGERVGKGEGGLEAPKFLVMPYYELNMVLFYTIVHFWNNCINTFIMSFNIPVVPE